MKKTTLKQALKELGEGKTKSQVAKKLRDAKIKGIQNSAGSCPIAAYLKKKGFANVAVGGDRAWISDDLDAAENLPQGCKEFIQAFDHQHQYKALRQS